MVAFAKQDTLRAVIDGMDDRQQLEQTRAKLLKAVLQIDEKLGGPFPEPTWREYLGGLLMLAIGSLALVLTMNLVAYVIQGCF